jgi:hypothetical protein
VTVFRAAQPGITAIDRVLDILEHHRRRQARRGIDAIDTVLEAVEQHHLAERPRSVPPLPEWIAWLEQEGGLSVPAHILRLKNTVQLHGALLDWQDELLSAALPARAQLVRAEGEGDGE